MNIEFWMNDPKILLNNRYIFELYPSSDMTGEQKLNAITRFVILLSMIALIFTRSIYFVIIGAITILAICVLFKTQYSQKKQKENFESKTSDVVFKKNTKIDKSSLKEFLKDEFQQSDKKNPFSNVLLTDIGDNPDRKSAQPAFNPDVYEDITRNTKKMIQNLNPDIKNTNKQLFGSLSDNYNLDQSNRAFFSTANTKVCNDQGAYAKFLYGDMPSGKESGLQRVQDNPRYTLY